MSTITKGHLWQKNLDDRLKDHISSFDLEYRVMVFNTTFNNISVISGGNI